MFKGMFQALIEFRLWNLFDIFPVHFCVTIVFLCEPMCYYVPMWFKCLGNAAANNNIVFPDIINKYRFFGIDVARNNGVPFRFFVKNPAIGFLHFSCVVDGTVRVPFIIVVDKKVK